MVFILVMIDHKHGKSLLLVRTRVMRTFSCLDILGKAGWGAKKNIRSVHPYRLIAEESKKEKRKKKSFT